MLKRSKVMFLMVPVVAVLCAISCLRAVSLHESPITAIPGKIEIILGSTRLGRSSDKIGKNLEKIAKAKGVNVEIIDLREYTLPFFEEEIIPAKRTVFLDPNVKRWSDKVREASAFVIVCPEYNAGYTGVLKNALDTLYVEWHNKPVGLVGYSGGLSGGAPMIAQLDQVVRRLKMVPVSTSIKIPKVGKAFDSTDNFIDPTIAHDFELMLDQLIAAQK
jgi:NAD(P)H-dependent FMN reductase